MPECLTVATGNIIIPKASGKGIKVDLVSPTFGWRDILGQITTRGVGATDPDWAAIGASVMSAFKFSINDVAWISFHIPHDYVAGTDLYFHVHWLSDGIDTTNVVKWNFDYMYADGHGQTSSDFPVDSLPAAVTSSEASGGKYRHMVTETAAVTVTGCEPDGIIYMKIGRVTNGATDTTDDIFVLQIDIHYQSTNIGTKGKAPDFYV